jgi:hypothetical protein
MEHNSYSIPVLNRRAAREIYKAAGWGKFISVVGIIFSVIFILLGLVFDKIVGQMFMSNPQLAVMPVVWITVIYIFLGLLYLFPCLFLYMFSAKSKKALMSNDDEMLALSFAGLRRCFQFIGVATLIIIVLYVLIMMGVFIGSMLGLSLA